MFTWWKKLLSQTGAKVIIEEPQEPANRIDALADRLAREGKAANIEDELETLDVAELSSP